MAQHSAPVPKPPGQASAPCPPALPTLSLTSKPPCSPVGSGRFEGYKEPKTQNPNMVPPSTLYTWWVSPRALHRLWLCREVPPQPPLAWWEPPALPCPALQPGRISALPSAPLDSDLSSPGAGLCMVCVTALPVHAVPSRPSVAEGQPGEQLWGWGLVGWGLRVTSRAHPASTRCPRMNPTPSPHVPSTPPSGPPVGPQDQVPSQVAPPLHPSNPSVPYYFRCILKLARNQVLIDMGAAGAPQGGAAVPVHLGWRWHTAGRGERGPHLGGPSPSPLAQESLG